MPIDFPLLCPSCGFTAPAAAFIPPRMTSRFDRTAFVLLTVVSVLALLKAIGQIK